LLVRVGNAFLIHSVGPFQSTNMIMSYFQQTNL